MNDFGVFDLPSKGVTFTCCNKREQDEVVREKIDRAIVNSKWLINFPMQ